MGGGTGGRRVHWRGRDDLRGRVQGRGSVRGRDGGRHRAPARSDRGSQHLALGREVPPYDIERAGRGRAVSARARGRAADLAREERAGDLGGTADRPQHRPHTCQQLNAEDGRPLAGAPRGERSQQRRPTPLSQANRATAVFPHSCAPATMKQCGNRIGSTAGVLRSLEPP